MQACVRGAILWRNSLPLFSGLNWTLRRCKRRADTILSVVFIFVSSFFFLKSLFCLCAVKISGGFTAEPFLTHNRPGNDQSKDFTTTYVEGRSLKIKLTCITSSDCLAIGLQGRFFFPEDKKKLFFLAVWHFIFFFALVLQLPLVNQSTNKTKKTIKPWNIRVLCRPPTQRNIVSI